MWGSGQRIRVMKYGKGPRRVPCPWAPNVLATPLVNNKNYHEGKRYQKQLRRSKGVLKFKNRVKKKGIIGSKRQIEVRGPIR